MIVNKRFSNRLFNAITKGKKISKLVFTQEEFDAWCHTLNIIAGLPYDVEMLGNYELNKYIIPTALTDLVIPRKISHVESIKWDDLRDERYVNYYKEFTKYGFDKDVEILVPLEFNEISNAILGAFRKETDNNTSKVTEFNGNVSAATWLPKFAEFGVDEETTFVAPSATSFIPVAVTSTQGLMKSKYYTQSLDVCIDTWIEDAINSLR